MLGFGGIGRIMLRVWLSSWRRTILLISLIKILEGELKMEFFNASWIADLVKDSGAQYVI